MSKAEKRAKELQGKRRIRDWVSRFRRLSEDMPPELWVYVANGAPCVMAKDSKGRIMEKPTYQGGCNNPDAIVAKVVGGHWDGGDW